MKPADRVWMPPVLPGDFQTFWRCGAYIARVSGLFAWHILALNPRERRQTKKYLALVPVARQVIPWLDHCNDAYFVGVQSIRSAWESMAAELGLSTDGEAGSKLIRRSMIKLLRDRLPKADRPEISMFLGHDKFDATSDIYAPFDPTYLNGARAEIEKIIDEIEIRVPGAFHRRSPKRRRFWAIKKPR